MPASRISPRDNTDVQAACRHTGAYGDRLAALEAWARQDLGESTIGVLLGLAPETFQATMAADPRIAEAMMTGRSKGIAAVAAALFGAATSDRDAGASRFYLERIAGGSWAPPRIHPPVVVIAAQPSLADQRLLDDMSRRFARQSALLDGRVIDGEADITAADTPAAGACTADSMNKK